MVAAGAGGMTATTTGLAGRQQARPAVLSACQSMADAAAAAARRSARSQREVACWTG
jgi:hypothetical protein